MKIETDIITSNRFSGHETFACRTFWLKKGYDFVADGYKFNSEEAVSLLGVGKNMVNSIKYWLHAFGLLDSNDELTNISHIIFSNSRTQTGQGFGYDPYLQHIETLWLLHFLLVTTNYATIYSLFFNEFRKQRFEFNEDHLKNFINVQPHINIKSDTTIQNDVRVLLSNYVFKRKKNDAVEDVSAILFADINLIDYKERFLDDKKLWYSSENKNHYSLTADVLLACLILSNQIQGTVSFQQLLTAKNNPGSVFCMTSEQLFSLLEKISVTWSDVVFSEDADIITIQGLDSIKFEDVLERIYE